MTVQEILPKKDEYYIGFCEKYLLDYLKLKDTVERKNKAVIIIFIFALIISLIAFSKPLFAKTDPLETKIEIVEQEEVYLEKNFKENIKNKYANSHITFPTKGIAHIKQTKYINSKPIKINIVELNTRVNQNLKIKPQTPSKKLNSKATVRKLAQNNRGIVAINAGFFKPQTGLPLGTLVIDGEILTGPIYNRSAIAIFEENNKTTFKIMNVSFDIKGYTKSSLIKIDNINQPRMLSTYNLIYTSQWGEFSPVAPANCYNILIQNNKVIKMSANPIKISSNDIVLQGPKEIIRQIARDKEIYIDIKLPAQLSSAKHIIGAGPFLVREGEIYVDVKTQKLNAITGKNPRSAIGYKNDGTLIIVTIDGREKNSVGMTLTETAKLMKKLGCDYAMNFDGGSSSALYVAGKIVNDAVNKEGIAVSNALVVSEETDEIKISKLD